MTDRHAGYVVTLFRDIREDDAEATITALAQIKGVASVAPILGGAEQQIAEARAHEKWRAALFDLVRNGPDR